MQVPHLKLKVWIYPNEHINRLALNFYNNNNDSNKIFIFVIPGLHIQCIEIPKKNNIKEYDGTSKEG